MVWSNTVAAESIWSRQSIEEVNFHIESVCLVEYMVSGVETCWARSDNGNFVVVDSCVCEQSKEVSLDHEKGGVCVDDGWLL